MALFSSSCSGGGGSGTATAGPGDAAPAAAAAEVGGPDSGDPATTTTTSPDAVGEPLSPYSLRPGDCFNVSASGDVFARVPCEAPHDREAFHAEDHPAPHGESHPGDLEMQQYALARCYQHFEPFAGTLYEVSRLEIGAITPTRDNFEDERARYRGITCFVHDGAGEQLVGSMRGRAE